MADNIHDGASGQFMLLGDLPEIDALLQYRFLRKRALPDPQALIRTGHGKVDYRLQPAVEGFIDIALHIGGQDHDPVELLDPLQQEADFLVGVAVVGIIDPGALAEQRIGFVKEEYPALVLGHVEYPGQVLLGFADVFGDDHAQVDPVDIAAALFAQQAGREGLAGAGRAVKQAGAAWLQPPFHPPIPHEPVSVQDPVPDLLQLFQGGPGQHQLFPFESGRDQTRRKFTVEIRFAHGGGGQPRDVFAGKGQRSAQERFAGRCRGELQNRMQREDMVAFEHLRHFETGGQVVAGQDEGGGLAGRDQAAVGRAAQSAELGEPSPGFPVGAPEHVQQLRADVGDQCQQQHQPFSGLQVVVPDEAGITGVASAQVRRRDRGEGAAIFAETGLDPLLQGPGKPFKLQSEITGVFIHGVTIL